MKFERSHLKQGWVDWLSELIWEMFITLDFNHKIQAIKPAIKHVHYAA